MRSTRILVVKGKVSCPARAVSRSVNDCRDCRWFEGLIQERHLLVECGLGPLAGALAPAREVPGRYLG